MFGRLTEQAGAKLAPASLPDQIGMMVALLSAQLECLQRLNDTLTSASADRPDPEPQVCTLPYATSEKLVITGVLMSGTVAGLHTLQVGTATVLQVLLPVNTPLFIPLDGDRRLIVARGLTVSFVPPGGGTGYCTLIAIPR